MHIAGGVVTSGSYTNTKNTKYKYKIQNFTLSLRLRGKGQLMSRIHYRVLGYRYLRKCSHHLTEAFVRSFNMVSGF